MWNGPGQIGVCRGGPWGELSVPQGNTGQLSYYREDGNEAHYQKTIPLYLMSKEGLSVMSLTCWLCGMA